MSAAASPGASPSAAAAEIAAGAERLRIDGLFAGYGRSDVLHGIDLRLGVGQSMCLIGPNGAGKSTVLNAVFGLADCHAGGIRVDGRDLDPRLPAAARLGEAGIAYVLQDSSVFPDLSVEQNLGLGGYLMRDAARRRAAVAAILERYPALARRRREAAGALSGGERRLLEIARALMMQPRLLLIDEPSIGLEPRAVTQVFETLRQLQRDGLSILLVEQNVRKGLAFADLACLLVAGHIVRAGPAAELLADPSIGSLFLGDAAAGRR